VLLMNGEAISSKEVITTEIPYGYCKCGCGKKTLIPTRNSKDKNWVKGVPMPYLRGHYNKAHGISDEQKRRLSENRKGAGNPMYKGANEYYDSHHGRYHVRKKDGTGWEGRHIAVAREKYGRDPLPNEVVHHINSDRTDDSPENLVYMDRGEHSVLHMTGSTRDKEKCRKNGKLGGLKLLKTRGREYFREISKIANDKQQATP